MCHALVYGKHRICIYKDLLMRRAGQRSSFRLPFFDPVNCAKPAYGALSNDCLCRYWLAGEQAAAVWERTWPYDMWSLGVIWLELILGTPHVFDVSSRTKVSSPDSYLTHFLATIVVSANTALADPEKVGICLS